MSFESVISLEYPSPYVNKVYSFSTLISFLMQLEQRRYQYKGILFYVSCQQISMASSTRAK